MPKLKHVYAGTPNIRLIEAADLKRHGVEGHTKTVWSPDNDHTAEVSQEAADWLLANEPGDWELLVGEGDDSSSSGDESTTDNDELPDLGESSDAVGTTGTTSTATTRGRTAKSR